MKLEKYTLKLKTEDKETIEKVIFAYSFPHAIKLAIQSFPEALILKGRLTKKVTSQETEN
jgi:hypothetical protein